MHLAFVPLCLPPLQRCWEYFNREIFAFGRLVSRLFWQSSVDFAGCKTRSGKKDALTKRDQANRPWIVVGPASLKAPLKAGETVQIEIEFTNSGKVPANKTRIQTWTTTTTKKAVKDFQRMALTDFQSSGVVA